MKNSFRGIAGVLIIALSLFAIPTLLNYPYDTDDSAGRSSSKRRSAAFYEAAYSPAAGRKRGIDYEETAARAAKIFDIEGEVRRFVEQNGLSGKRVLEVGSGRGNLQDMVSDYTGLDISSSVAGHYHKPFVVASATAMPFPDNTFDAVWTVWVLEHIPEPERALTEMRRVLKPGGLLFLYVAWNCTPWAADGFDVRPYSDFNWRGKLAKASLIVRKAHGYQVAWLAGTRALRWAQMDLACGNTRLHFRRLEPTYEVYWEADSDAAVSVDSFEAYLWFRAHGDECLNCPSPGRELRQDYRNPLILRIRK